MDLFFEKSKVAILVASSLNFEKRRVIFRPISITFNRKYKLLKGIGESPRPL